MSNFSVTVATTPVEAGTLGVFFLGQAGFVFKTSQGRLAVIDPYLSDCCHRYFGFKRLMPYLLAPNELTFDLLLVSHAHYDHFDPDSVPQLMANSRTQLIGALDVRAECERLGITDRLTFLEKNQSVSSCGFDVTALPCDHGKDTPHALGLLLEAEGKRIYYMGDTAYRSDILEDARLQHTDLLLLPINGAFGNLNETEAAQVVATLRPKLAIPYHYWNFAQHGGDPQLFMREMERLCPDQPYLLMRQGEGLLL